MTIDLILLDRDGVINEDSEDYIKSPDEWRPIAGSLAAIGRLAAAGKLVGICTNQAGIGRGIFKEAALTAIHQRLQAELHALGATLHDLRYCPHHPDSGCNCRKPAPGMLIDSCNLLGIKPGNACYVGDSAIDIEAARNAGCLPLLVRTGNGQKTESQLTTPVATFDNLAKVADAIISGENITN